ncbi:hypothetical protein SS50377_22293 [Spironucleus salmonicida]|uniref:Uncharacterized protein n=1 Tax=Spironucleus salmonicida TaxID=348837 RepID=V6LCN7_9EUKA|nr:hypothetical protein SS50377_22293 [Spironucleus salmonicida]|eukprot:EST42212.1 Hypothetical protein SS50377_18514 [Spironucleus salmonicida]
MDFVSLDDYNAASLLFSKSDSDPTRDLNLFLQATINRGVNLNVSSEDSSIILEAIHALNKKQQESSQLEQEITRMRQDFSLREKRFEDIQKQSQKENKQLIIDQLNLNAEVRQLNAQLQYQETQLKKQIRIYDDVVAKLDISEHAKRRLILEIDGLKVMNERLRKNQDETVVENSKNSKIGSVLENKIRDLYFDIYQIRLEKPGNNNLNEAVLAEAITHVKKTYNEDMENITNENQLLRTKLGIE